MSFDRENVCVLIPTLNEAPTIGEIISAYKNLGFLHILIIDGHSTDGTIQIAQEHAARVITQKDRGKGKALIEAFGIIEQPYILMVDGDGTYDPKDADRLLGPLEDGADHVIGNRLTSDNRNAFSRLNYAGNQILNRLFKVAHGYYLNDILSGYRAFTRDSIRQLQLHEAGFGIETEISAESVRNGQDIRVVPVKYRKRAGTPTKLNPFHDGIKITSTIYRLAKMNNPMFYFGMIGILIMITGLLVGIYVIFEWLRHVEHLPLSILTVLLIVVGFQIFMFGVISDMLLAFHREVIREMQTLRNPLSDSKKNNNQK